jgi:hypothetical protein
VFQNLPAIDGDDPIAACVEIIGLLADGPTHAGGVTPPLEPQVVGTAVAEGGVLALAIREPAQPRFRVDHGALLLVVVQRAQTTGVHLAVASLCVAGAEPIKARRRVKGQTKAMPSVVHVAQTQRGDSLLAPVHPTVLAGTQLVVVIIAPAFGFRWLVAAVDHTYLHGPHAATRVRRSPLARSTDELILCSVPLGLSVRRRSVL